MFIRKKKNRSGTVSIVVVDKHNGKFKELHTVGIAKCEEDIAPLMHEGRKWIDSHLGVQRIDFDFYEKISDEESAADMFWDNIDSVILNGAKLILPQFRS